MNKTDRVSTPFHGVTENVEDVQHQDLIAISTWLKKTEVINSFRC